MTTSKPRRVRAASPESVAVSVPGCSAEAEPIRVVFVDDDDDYREAATAELVDLNFIVENFADSASMLAAAADGFAADVILLASNLPGTSGIHLVPRLRRQGILLPVVILIGRSPHAIEHLAFDRAAVNFVEKSLGVPILAERIRALVESSERSA